MRYRPFGNTDLVTSEVGFGCARIGGVFQASGRTEIVALLREAVQRGVTFFDTADMYTQGESERLLGEAVQSVRHDVIIATKFGYQLPHQKQLVSRIKPWVRPLVKRLRLNPGRVHASVRGSVSRQDFSAAYISAAVERSLRRLKTDYIDIYQLHDPPSDVIERGEFVETLESLKQQGKIRHWGVAVQQPEDAVVALRYRELSSVQVGLSVLEQAALDTAIPSAANRGVGVIARQVFASGLLTRPLARIDLRDIDHEHAVAVRKHDQLAAYAVIAEQCGRTPTEMALQFNLDRDDISVVLVGISRYAQLETALESLKVRPLSPDENKLLIQCRRTGR